MKTFIRIFLLAGAAITLAGCSTMARLETQHVKLDNGKTVTIDRVQPTKDWGCTMVARPIVKNWVVARTEGNFNLEGGYGVLKDEALAKMNKQHINANYIYVHIPNTVNVGGVDVTMARKGYVNFYRCKRINPENKFETARSVSIG